MGIRALGLDVLLFRGVHGHFFGRGISVIVSFINLMQKPLVLRYLR